MRMFFRESARCKEAGQSHVAKPSEVKETYEDDDLVDTVDEFGREVALDGTHDELLRRRVDGAVTHVVEEGSAKVTRHDDDGIPEVHDATLTVGQAAVVEYLQEELHELPCGLLDLVDEHDRVRFATDVLRELAALVVADVSRRCTNESGDRVLL